MNKKIVHLLATKLPIVSVIILILAYAYLSIPDNCVLQVGGVDVANTFKLPKNTPWKYKYRWVFVLIPVLIILHLIYSVYYYFHVKSLTIWDLGKDFFAQFQTQVSLAISTGVVPSPSKSNDFSYENIPEPSTTNDPNIKKLINIIQLSGSPGSGLYKEAQYFCASFRPCSCCEEPGFQEYFAPSGMVAQCKNVKDGIYDKVPDNSTPSYSSPSK